jgi:hypothetical protein
MSRSRFLNQKLGKRTSRKYALLKTQFGARRTQPATPEKSRPKELRPGR